MVNKLELQSLPADVQMILRTISVCADARRVSAWLVGGMVRDLLLRRTSLDVDVVVEEDAIDFAAYVAKELKGQVLAHRRFGTAVVTLADGFKIDLVTSRREIYARPGVLPDILSGQLSDDLFRRDFTINAVAAALTKSGLGEIRDDFDGIADLRKGLIRIMHYRSFVDDPTRILRAVRYEKRFDFVLEERTLSALKTACNEDAFMTITPVRYFNEFRRILQEDDPIAPLRRLRSLDGLRYLSFGPDEEKLLEKIVRSQKATQGLDGQWVWIGRLAGLLAFQDSKRAQELLNIFNIERSDKKRIQEFLHFLDVPDISGRLRQEPLPPERKTRRL